MLIFLSLLIGRCGSVDIVDIIFIVDASGSIGINNWNTMITFIKNVITRFGSASTNSRFAFVKFSSSANVEFALNHYTNTNDVKRAVDRIGYTQGGTNIASGLAKARRNIIRGSGDRNNAPNIAILITDGQDSSNALSEANQIKQLGTKVITIGIGSGVKANLLRSLASFPSYYKAVNSFSNLSNIIQSLVGTACSRR